MIERWERWKRVENLKHSAWTSLSLLSKKHDDHEWSFHLRNLWWTIVLKMTKKRITLIMSSLQDLQRQRKKNSWELIRCQIDRVKLFWVFKWLDSFIKNQWKIACEYQKRREERSMTVRITTMKMMMKKKKMKKTETLWTRIMQRIIQTRALMKLCILCAKFIWIKVRSSYRLCWQLEEEFDLELKD